MENREIKVWHWRNKNDSFRRAYCGCNIGARWDWAEAEGVDQVNCTGCFLGMLIERDRKLEALSAPLELEADIASAFNRLRMAQHGHELEDDLELVEKYIKNLKQRVNAAGGESCKQK